jgi:hypothetical protein
MLKQFLKLKNKFINKLMVSSIKNSYEDGSILYKSTITINKKCTCQVGNKKVPGYVTQSITIENIINEYIDKTIKELNEIIPVDYKDEIFDIDNQSFYKIISHLKTTHKKYAENMFNTILTCITILFTFFAIVINMIFNIAK